MARVMALPMTLPHCHAFPLVVGLSLQSSKSPAALTHDPVPERRQWIAPHSEPEAGTRTGGLPGVVQGSCVSDSCERLSNV
jgi:hypothetical protein